MAYTTNWSRSRSEHCAVWRGWRDYLDRLQKVLGDAPQYGCIWRGWHPTSLLDTPFQDVGGFRAAIDCTARHEEDAEILTEDAVSAIYGTS